MAKTLQQILIDINSNLDLDAALPTGTELETRSNYANQAIWEASSRGQLREFKREYLTNTASLVTISLPSDFRELHQDPKIKVGGNWEEWRVIEAEHKYEMSDADRYCYILGDAAQGYNLIFNAIVPDADLSIMYQKTPTGMPSLGAMCELPDPQYVIRSVEAMVLYGRSDDRFLVAEQRAEQSLANMIGRGMKASDGRARRTHATFRNPLAR